MKASATIFLITLVLCITQIAYGLVCPSDEYFFPANFSCVTSCPRYYYLTEQNNQSVCLAQTSVKGKVRSTVEERVFILVFNDSNIPYTSAQDFDSKVVVDLVSVASNFSQKSASISSIFLTEDRTIMQFKVNTDFIPQQTTLSLRSPSFTRDNSSKSNFKISPEFYAPPYMTFSQSKQKVIDALTKLDRAFEYTWIAVTCFNPYAFLYMNVKLYRETLEMFKRIDVQSGPFATQFFKRNNNKVSGFKLPNMFPIIFTGDHLSSGWDRGEENNLPFGGINPKRVQDLNIFTTHTVHDYDAFPLFLDNYGIQITVFLGIAALIIMFEISNIILGCNRRYSEISKRRRVFQAVRTYLKWNLLLASIIGSFQSFMFYFMLQMKVMSQMTSASYNSQSSHNDFNFWFAIGTFIILGLFFPIWLSYKLITLCKQRRKSTKRQIYRDSKRPYGILFMINDIDRRLPFTYLFAIMLRAIIFAAIMVFVTFSIKAQVISMLCVTLLFTLYMFLTKPFLKLRDNVFCFCSEIVLVLTLLTQTVSAFKTDTTQLDDETSGYILIGLWFLAPLIGVVFGIFGLVANILKIKRDGTLALPISMEVSQKAESPSQIHNNSNSKKILKLGSQEESFGRKSVYVLQGQIPSLEHLHSTDPLMTNDLPQTVGSQELQTKAALSSEERDKSLVLVHHHVEEQHHEETPCMSSEVVLQISEIPRQEMVSDYMLGKSVHKQLMEIPSHPNSGPTSSLLLPERVTLADFMTKRPLFDQIIELPSQYSSSLNNSPVVEQRTQLAGVVAEKFIFAQRAETNGQSNKSVNKSLDLPDQFRVQKQDVVLYMGESNLEFDQFKSELSSSHKKVAKGLDNSESSLAASTVTQSEEKGGEQIQNQQGENVMPKTKKLTPINQFSSARSSPRSSFVEKRNVSPKRTQDTHKVGPLKIGGFGKQESEKATKIWEGFKNFPRYEFDHEAKIQETLGGRKLAGDQDSIPHGESQSAIKKSSTQSSRVEGNANNKSSINISRSDVRAL